MNKLEDDIAGVLKTHAGRFQPGRADLDQIRAKAKTRSLRSRTPTIVLAITMTILTVVAISVLLPLEKSGPHTAASSGLVVTASIEVGASPYALATDKSGVWVALQAQDGCAGAIVHVAALDNRVSRTVDVPVFPVGVTVTHGDVWVAGPSCTSGDNQPSLLRVDSSTFEIEETIPIRGDISAIAAGDSAVWIATDEAGSTALYRLDPTSARSEPHASLDGRTVEMQVDASGDVWLLQAASDMRLHRIDASSGRVLTEIEAPIVSFVVSDDSVWFASSLPPYGDTSGSNDGQNVVAADLLSGAVTRPPIAIGDVVFKPFAADSDGLWAVSGRNDARIVHLNTVNGRFDASLVVGSHHSLAPVLDVQRHAVWVADQAGTSVIRIDVS